MVSIPETTTKRQGNIVPSTLEQVLTMLNEYEQALDLKDKQLEEQARVIQSQNEDLDLQQTCVENLNAQVDRATTPINKYEHEKIYEHELFANSDLGSSEKLVLLASRNVIRELRSDDDTSLSDFHLNNIVSMTRLTTETVGKKLKSLDDVFNTIEYKPKKVYAGKDNDGKSLFVSDTKLAFLPLVDQLHVILLPKGAPCHSGAREKKVCPQCGSDRIQRDVWSQRGVQMHVPFERSVYS